jgi:hypothetical protein
MIVKYASKFVLDILPSVVATIIGAYIVNHYIVTKPAADAPVAASVSTADPKTADRRTDVPAAKSDVRGSETPSEPDVANASEPAAIRNIPLDKAAVEKSIDKPTETASSPVETRRHQPVPHDRTVAKAPPVPAPAVATAMIAPPVETSPAQDERRDANDLARAAIERLRNSSEASRAADAARVQDSRGQDLPRVVPAPVRPLPPPIMVSTPPAEAINPNAAASPRPYYPPVARAGDPGRPTPPADIPGAQPTDLQAEATGSTPVRTTTVADDVLSVAKSVFHAVLPR